MTPGQACAYALGKQAMLDLRRRAQSTLGAAFDLRAFHDALLGSGPLPLPILIDNLEAWIEERRRDA